MKTAFLHEKAVATESLDRSGFSSPANHTFLDQFRRPVPAVFWYQINGTSYADRSLAKLATVRQAFLHGRTDGALVAVISEPRHDQADDQWKALKEFAGLILSPYARVSPMKRIGPLTIRTVSFFGGIQRIGTGLGSAATHHGWA